MFRPHVFLWPTYKYRGIRFGTVTHGLASLAFHTLGDKLLSRICSGISIFLALCWFLGRPKEEHAMRGQEEAAEAVYGGKNKGAENPKELARISDKAAKIGMKQENGQRASAVRTG